MLKCPDTLSTRLLLLSLPWNRNIYISKLLNAFFVFFLFTYRHASVIIVGDDANDKALALNGSELGGRKLVVTVEKFPQLQMRDVPFG